MNDEGGLQWLLREVAESVRPCRYCKRMLYFVKTKSGKLAPLTDEAKNHFLDCPHFQKQPQPTVAAPAQASLLDVAPEPLD